jgi:hypothetical protein
MADSEASESELENELVVTEVTEEDLPNGQATPSAPNISLVEGPLRGLMQLQALIALDTKVILTPPCIFHQ